MLNITEKFIKNQKVAAARSAAYFKKQVRSGNMPDRLSMPIGVQFELTAKCNLACRHCYNLSSNNRKDIMKFEDWSSVVADINNKGGIFECILSGGEPLLFGDKMFDLMGPLHDNGTAFVLLTNGFLVTQDIVNKLKKYDWFFVQVSIDHLLEKEHDKFRGKEGSWKRAVNAALMFSSAGLPLRIAHSMTPQAVAYIPEFADFCYKLGASSLVCGNIMLSGNAFLHKDILMNEEQIEEMHKQVCIAQKTYKDKLNIAVASTEHIELKRRQKELNTSVLIRPNGDVRLDCIAPFTIGNVLQKPLSQIWEEKGNKCWKDKKISDYIANLDRNGYNISHVNHYDPDLLI